MFIHDISIVKILIVVLTQIYIVNFLKKYTFLGLIDPSERLENFVVLTMLLLLNNMV